MRTSAEPSAVLAAPLVEGAAKDGRPQKEEKKEDKTDGRDGAVPKTTD